MVRVTGSRGKGQQCKQTESFKKNCISHETNRFPMHCFHGWIFACYLQIGMFEQQARNIQTETWFSHCMLVGVA